VGHRAALTACYGHEVRWIGLLLLLGCRAEERRDEATPPPAPSVAAPASAPTPSAAPPAEPSEIVLVAGGDVSFGRLLGQRLLHEPQHDAFATVRALLDPADLRFVNLECTISDQGGETQSPISQLVFTAPPATAPALARARIDVVSLANNHAWDYGEAALRETFERLEAEKVVYVGAGRTRAEAYAPRVIERKGVKLAFLAVTAVWNQALEGHPGLELVANAEVDTLRAAVREAKAIDGVDQVIVSHHGGYEYVDRPHPGTLELLSAAVEAGADVIIGHHPHVVQRAGFLRGKPIFYSLGNLLMRMVTGKPWTQFGMLARLRLGKAGAVSAEICPFRIHGFEPIPLAGDPQRAVFEEIFRAAFVRLLDFGARERPETATRLGAFGADGCAPVTPQ
jgi:poly-gamma-glutamate capsule biosynthesis protein CapA/YwtB (metallophosphatase superfamily)